MDTLKPGAMLAGWEATLLMTETVTWDAELERPEPYSILIIHEKSQGLEAHLLAPPYCGHPICRKRLLSLAGESMLERLFRAA